MFKEAADARSAIEHTFRHDTYITKPACWRSLKKGINRDLQAKRLRPNVPVPSRRALIQYLAMMYRETGSITDSLTSLLYDGSWTSSGGSFKLAKLLNIDIPAEISSRLSEQSECRFLEIGGGWAGFADAATNSSSNQSIAGIAKTLEHELGKRLFLDFTNLTQWHDNLPKGVREHPFFTAASIGALTQREVPAGTVDIIFSQAAAYFETNPVRFIRASAYLLRPGGLLIFNHQERFSDDIKRATETFELVQTSSLQLGGMNGVVVALQKTPCAIEGGWTSAHLTMREAPLLEGVL